MTKDISVFRYSDYREFLAQYLAIRRGGEKGVQTKMAGVIGCQPAYVSKVLTKEAHFSLEQAERVSFFCNHIDEERDFFMCLVQHNRASTIHLKKYFSNQLQHLKIKNQDLKEHMKLERVEDLETQLKYYSHWSIVAIHVLLTIPGFRTRGAIGSQLNLSVADVNSAIDFLKSKGMVEENSGELSVGQVALHLGADSLVVKQHHYNWRIKAMDSIARGLREDLHYSSVVSVSEVDKERFRADLIKWIANFRKDVSESKEEGLAAIAIDFYNL